MLFQVSYNVLKKLSSKVIKKVLIQAAKLWPFLIIPIYTEIELTQVIQQAYFWNFISVLRIALFPNFFM